MSTTNWIWTYKASTFETKFFLFKKKDFFLGREVSKMVKTIITIVIATVVVDLTVALVAKGYTFATVKLFKKGEPVVA